MNPRWAALLVLLSGLSARAEEDKGLQHLQAVEEHRRLAEERRRALVIGASSYQSVPRLPGAAHDVALVSDALEAAGFEITLSRNEDKKDIERAIIDFAVATRPEDVVLVYWSGHGVQRDGKNWLIPVDAELSNPERLSSEAIDLDLLLRTLGEHHGRLNMVLLDACRNNPWDRGWSASGKALGGSGLAQPASTPSGFLIAYATDPGRTAADGGDGPGPYAQALADNIASEWELQEVFQRVHAQVERASGGGQRPWVTMALGPGRFFFTLPSAEDYLRRYGAGEPLGQLRVRAGFGGSLVIDGIERGELARRGSLALDLAPGDREVCLRGDCQQVHVAPGEVSEVQFREETVPPDWSPILEFASGYAYGDVGLAYVVSEDADSRGTPTALGQGGALTAGVSVTPRPWLRAGLMLGVESVQVSAWLADDMSCLIESKGWGAFPCRQGGLVGFGALRLVGAPAWDRRWEPTLGMELSLRGHGRTEVALSRPEQTFSYYPGWEASLGLGPGVRLEVKEALRLGFEILGDRPLTAGDDATPPTELEGLGLALRLRVKVEVTP